MKDFLAVRPARLRGLMVIRGSFSHINAQVEAALRRVRPDIDLDVIDLKKEFKEDILGQLRCLLGVQREYGLSSWSSKDMLRYRLARSQAYYRAASGSVRDRFDPAEYDFTLQTQSLFNAALPGIPNFVYTDHVARAGMSSLQGQFGAPSDGWFACERQIYAQAEHVFTFGPKIRRMLIEHYGLASERATAIGAGASVLPQRPVEISPERYARRRILFVGVDWERKGGPELVEAFELLRKRLPDVTLTVIGCSPEIEVEGVEVLGRLPLEEVAEHFHEASCFCMPSRLEPFGVVFVEAMQFGLPVVSTDVGDIASIVVEDETGHVVPARDPAALSEALFRTLSMPDRAQRLGAAAKDRAAQFTWDAVAQRIASHFPGEPAMPRDELEVAW
ncbi:glycosyltransferase family 4 protein [Alloyangia pacifica]|uniref:glycosyltransferase family 4 protein n=1 Tax=Alloyangia pacifica TaxID=311180 RepID=UPI001CFCB9A5|nr:glycosyltransferase family 4 protein [Alloyangia pacifica]